MKPFLSAIAGLALPAVALAHDGHGTPGMLVEIASAVADGDRLTVTALLTNIADAPQTLTSLGAGGGALVLASEPVDIAAGETRRLVTALDFVDGVPGILTLTFDFGVNGAGPVLILPERAEASDAI